MTPTVAILGCGNRGGDVYARHLTAQGARVVALVDGRPERLGLVGERAGVPQGQRFKHWNDFFALGKVADAVVIATPDDQHVQPCVRALDLGYHVLLEKPVCLSEAELDRLLAAESRSSGQVTVCHVLRATPFFREIKRLLDTGRVGQLVGIQHAENVAYWHYAHSFVRGNWRVSPPAAPFVLAKSCHDLDVLRWFAGSPPERVSSEGGVHHFRPEKAPAGAAKRCLDCPAAPECPFDARQIYLSRELDHWPVTVVSQEATEAAVLDALRTGPYGECVYLGRNNVADHQAVTVRFNNGVTAQLTVSAFTHNNTRTLKLLGTRGELRAHMDRGEIEVHDFLTGELESIWVDASGNHGGGDTALVAAWLAFLKGEAEVPTPLAESLDSHRMAFAAERARLGGTVELV